MSRLAHSGQGAVIPGETEAASSFKPSRETFRDRPKILAVMDDNQKRLARGLVGSRKGHLVILGIADVPRGTRTEKGYTRRLKWVVQCSCGAYEVRHTGALTNPDNRGDACQHCGYARRVLGGWVKADATTPAASQVGMSEANAPNHHPITAGDEGEAEMTRPHHRPIMAAYRPAIALTGQH